MNRLATSASVAASAKVANGCPVWNEGGAGVLARSRTRRLRRADLLRQLRVVDDLWVVHVGVVAGPRGVREEHGGDPGRDEGRVVAAALAEDLAEGPVVERARSGRCRHHVLKALAPGLRTDGEGDVAEARPQVGALDVEVHVGHHVLERHEGVGEEVARAEEAVLLPVPEREHQ